MTDRAPSRDVAEWPVTVALADVPKAGLRIAYTAPEAALSELAAMLDVPIMIGLRSDLTVGRWRDGLRVAGDLEAVAERDCVVSLDRFTETTRTAFERRYRPGNTLPDQVDIDPEGEDDPDELVAGTVDISALLAEELALVLDPHPRKPGVDFDAASTADDDGAKGRHSPFAVLDRLRGGDGDKP